MTAVTVSVGDRSRSLAGSRVVAAGLALAVILLALGLLAGRWTAPTAASAGRAPATAGPVHPDRVPVERAPFGTTEYPCAVGRPC